MFTYESEFWEAASLAMLMSFADYVKSPLRQWGPQRALHERNGSEIGPRVSEKSLRPSGFVWGCNWHLLGS